ncbi:MAG: DNA helicase RecQ [Caulobacteraceae bacterium]
MPVDSLLGPAREVLRRTFGHEDFRGLQADVVGEILAGRNALAVLPTGGGKSLCFQIPSLLREGLGIVVSPLIALMADQVAGLQQLGVAAERLDSNTTPNEREAIWRRIGEGGLDLLYMSPEGLMQPGMLNRLADRQIALVAIDEAHCVSQWGHDFRPEYRTLGRLAEVFAGVPRLAVTATADAKTRDDIRNELRLMDSREFVDSFARPELALSAERKTGQGHARVEQLVLARPNRAGVVYTGSRDGADKLAARLVAQGVHAKSYHAGLDKAVRADRLSRFLDEEEAVMVATIAFGMGIDKPDVRFVIHADPPASMEAYWQEVGRAGRDKAAAEGITLYGASDLAWALRRIDEREISDEVKRVQVRKVRQLYGMLDGANCRAAAVRTYFGEAGVQPCGQCDVCLGGIELHDATQAAQKALSAIHRLGGRFGRGRVVDHLLGKTKDVSQSEAAMTTFGVGQELTPGRWRDLLDQLLFDGLLREEPNDGRPLITLGDGEAVRQVYRGEKRIQVRAPAKGAAGATGTTRRDRPGTLTEVPAGDRGLFDALRAWRKEQAALQHVPPYVIFHDRTLLEIAAAKPASLVELGLAGGVGQGKLDRYGEAVLKVVQADAASGV